MTTDQPQDRLCTECEQSFVYTVAEQQFRDEHGMSAPIRCPECRSRKRAQRNADLITSNAGSAFNGADRGGDRRRQSRNARSNNAADRYPAICADCGASTMVPFVPRGDRPVYCRSCFNARRGR